MLRLLRGNPGKRALNENEPQPTVGFPPCPDRLQGVARESWERFAKELEAAGVGTKLDAVALEMLADSYAAYIEALEMLVKGGPVWVGAKGDSGLPTFVYSPYGAVANKQKQFIHKFLAEFGMTPSSRSSVQKEKPAASKKSKYFA